jgi:hypothetical protein
MPPPMIRAPGTARTYLWGNLAVGRFAGLISVRLAAAGLINGACAAPENGLTTEIRVYQKFLTLEVWRSLCLYAGWINACNDCCAIK